MRDETRRMVVPGVLLAMGAVPAVFALARYEALATAIASGATLAMGSGFLALHVARERRLEQSGRRETVLQAQIASLEQRCRGLGQDLDGARATDETTGVLNRRTFLARLEETLQRDARLGRPLSFLLVDIDGFRATNDAFGRLTADGVLRATAATLQSVSRGTDVVGRVGGDEFAVCLGECADPRPVVDRLFVALEATRLPGPDAGPIRVSVGQVVVESPADGADAFEIFHLAEGALASVRGGGGGASARRTIPKPVAREVSAR